MTHALFGRQGATVIELRPPTHVLPHFRWYSMHAGLDWINIDMPGNVADIGQVLSALDRAANS